MIYHKSTPNTPNQQNRTRVLQDITQNTQQRQTHSRAKRHLRLECRQNAKVREVSDVNVPEGQLELECLDCLQWRVKNRTPELTTFYLAMTQELYIEHEVFNHNFYGNSMTGETVTQKKTCHGARIHEQF